MADHILQKSPPKELKKTEPELDPEILLSYRRSRLPVITGPIHTQDRHTPTIETAKAGYLPGLAGYFASILELTVSNLTLLHKYLSKIEEMLEKGGER